jgi:CheY-like chemotaxis protein
MNRNTVLIIEDHHDIREAIESILRMEGYRVHGVRNGEEALDALNLMGRPGLILLDMMMPVLDGWNFLQILGTDTPVSSVPIVVVTAFSPDAIFAEMPEPANVVGFIQKPIAVDKLLSYVRDYCGEGDEELAQAALLDVALDAARPVASPPS